MSKPINLNKARKERNRAARRLAADANAVKFGRSKAEKKLEAARRAKADDGLDAHRRDDT